MSISSIQRRPSGFTLVEIAFIVIIVCICILLLTPFIRDIRSKARILACEENLEKIGLGLKLYAVEHEGEFPASLDGLPEGNYVGNETDLDYHYVTGYTASYPSESAIVFDKIKRHKRGKHVLYVGGEIEWLAGEPVD